MLKRISRWEGSVLETSGTHPPIHKLVLVCKTTIFVCETT